MTTLLHQKTRLFGELTPRPDEAREPEAACTVSGLRKTPSPTPGRIKNRARRCGRAVSGKLPDSGRIERTRLQRRRRILCIEPGNGRAPVAAVGTEGGSVVRDARKDIGKVLGRVRTASSAGAGDLYSQINRSNYYTTTGAEREHLCALHGDRHWPWRPSRSPWPVARRRMTAR